jgi:hypothetical protein
LLNDVTKEKNKSSTKNKPPTVITSRKERKKMKKASKDEKDLLFVVDEV